MMCPNLEHIKFYKLLKVDQMGFESTTSVMQKFPRRVFTLLSIEPSIYRASASNIEVDFKINRIMIF
jgi:hypothetical protein